MHVERYTTHKCRLDAHMGTHTHTHTQNAHLHTHTQHGPIKILPVATTSWSLHPLDKENWLHTHTKKHTHTHTLTHSHTHTHTHTRTHTHTLSHAHTDITSVWSRAGG